MTLPVSPNTLSFSQIQTEFGGSNPISLSEYYRSGSYVRTNTNAPAGPIVTTGAISLSTFRGATQGVLTPTYSFGTIPTSINEGSSGTFNVTTTNVDDGTTLYWTIATNAGDFSTTSGSFTITSNAGSFSVSPSADATTETTAETFTVSIRTGSTSGTVQATSSAVTINDTSQTAAATYSFGTIPTSINEGSSGTFNVTTTNVDDGTTLYWTIATNASDFSTTSGSFTITSNAGSFSVSPSADATTEPTAETFTVSIRTGSISGTVRATSSAVTINDTSQTPPSSATWSVGFSNSGTPGAINTFVLVTLNRAATVSTTYTFTGKVVENNAVFNVPNVTIPVGSTASNPNAASGFTNGSGPYVNITLRVTPATVPYPLTPSTAIDTTFRYSA